MSADTSDGLPAWIALARWFMLPGFAWGATILFTRLFERALVPRAPAAPLPWPENAEALRRASTAIGVGLLVPLVQLWIVLSDQIYGAGASLPGGLLLAIVLALILAVVAEQRRFATRHGGLVLDRREYWRMRLVWALVAKWPVGIALLFFFLVRGAASWREASLAAGLALYAGFYFGLGERVLALLGWARPAGERLRTSLARVAERAGMSVPCARELDHPLPNAFLVPVSRSLCVTRRALEILTEDELEAVLAHELGHLRERRRLVVAMLPSHAAFVGILLACTLLQGLALWVTLALLTVVALLTRILLPRFMRAAEERADAFARRHADPTAFARALDCLYRANLIPPRRGSGALHPDFARRIEAAGASVPSDLGAAPPRRAGVFVLVLVLAFACAFGLRDLVLVKEDLPFPRLTLALRGPEPFSIAALAQAEERAGRDEAARRLYGGGSALEPANPWWPMEEARLLARLGRCDEARARFAEAERLCQASGEFDCEGWLAQGAVHLAGCP